jgi:hypothetical protein
MTRLSPKEIYKASVKCLKTNTSKDMHTDGARLDYYMRHQDFLVTVHGQKDKPVYEPIDRLAGTNFAAQKQEVTA